MIAIEFEKLLDRLIELRHAIEEEHRKNCARLNSFSTKGTS